ncbi:hypothetical protein [Actinoplanes sp. NPDC049802]|uniref:hypothetical protein n=1 Tax=Actinoplanes sp. NPDC049802 TaxID=3154742 RepID=UPI0033C47F39
MLTIRRSLALLAAALCVTSLPGVPAAARPAGSGEEASAGTPPAMTVVQRAGGESPAGVRGPIPDEALLGPADLGGVTPLQVDRDSWPRLRPPRPCEGGYPEPVADRAVTAVIEVNKAPNAVMEYLAVHRPGDARRYLRELRDVLKVCKGTAWRIEATGVAGPDSLLLRYSDTFEHVDEWITHHTYLVIARSGRAVVLVADAGWETDSGDPALARELIIPALRRAAALH